MKVTEKNPQTFLIFAIPLRGRRGRDRMVVGFIVTCAISAYQDVTSNPVMARCTRYDIM